MAPPLKLDDDIWDDVRSRWEGDPRDGYAWLVAEMAIGVTRAAVRNKALREDWRKNSQALKAKAREQSKRSTPPRCRCSCCGNHRHVENCKGSSGNTHEIPDDQHLLHALELIASGVSLLRETIRQRNLVGETLPTTHGKPCERGAQNQG